MKTILLITALATSLPVLAGSTVLERESVTRYTQSVQTSLDMVFRPWTGVDWDFHRPISVRLQGADDYRYTLESCSSSIPMVWLGVNVAGKHEAFIKFRLGAPVSAGTRASMTCNGKLEFTRTGNSALSGLVIMGKSVPIHDQTNIYTNSVPPPGLTVDGQTVTGGTWGGDIDYGVTYSTWPIPNQSSATIIQTAARSEIIYPDKITLGPGRKVEVLKYTGSPMRVTWTTNAPADLFEIEAGGTIIAPGNSEQLAPNQPATIRLKNPATAPEQGTYAVRFDLSLV